MKVRQINFYCKCIHTEKSQVQKNLEKSKIKQDDNLKGKVFTEKGPVLDYKTPAFENV